MKQRRIRKFAGQVIKSPHTRRAIKDITDKAIKQDEFGYKKYGQYLDPFDPKYDWLNMAEEELVDMMKYFHAERERRDANLSQLLRLQESMLKRLESFRGGDAIPRDTHLFLERSLYSMRKGILSLSKNLEGQTGQTTKDKEINH